MKQLYPVDATVTTISSTNDSLQMTVGSSPTTHIPDSPLLPLPPQQEEGASV